MEERKSISISLSTLFFILALIVIIIMACYIYSEKTNTNKEIATLESSAVEMQKIIKDLQEQLNNDEFSENLVDKVALGSYQVTEHIEDEAGISYDDVGVTFASNNLCSVHEGYGFSHIGTYSLKNNKIICNTIICRGESGGIGYHEGNIIFEFEIISKDTIKLVNVINNSNNDFSDIALKSGMTYKLSDANILVLIDNN